MIPKKSINAILDALVAQQQQGATSLIARIEPGLIADARNALPGYRKLFAPFIPGVTDTSPIYAAYEQLQTHLTRHTILLLVECQTIDEFREAVGRLPIRKSSEWRSLDEGNWEFTL